MINYFRASLSNLAADNSSPMYSGAAYDINYLPYAYTVKTLDAKQQPIYNILFPVGGDRTGTLAYTNAYTKLLHAFALDDVFSMYDPSLSYYLSDLDSFDSGWYTTNTVNFPSILTALQTNNVGWTFASNFMVVPRYREMYNFAYPSMQRLAGFVAGYAAGITP